MKFYAASSSDESGVARTKEFIAKARAAGHECTCDWTEVLAREHASARVPCPACRGRGGIGCEPNFIEFPCSACKGTGRKAPISDGEVPGHILYMSANADRRGVRDAQVLVYLAPSKKSEGAAWELGYARGILDEGRRQILQQSHAEGLGCSVESYPALERILIVGSERGMLFTLLEEYRVDTIDEAVRWLSHPPGGGLFVESQRRALKLIQLP